MLCPSIYAIIKAGDNKKRKREFLKVILVILHPFPEKPHDMKRKTKIAQNAAGRM
jgi:hypothetical protein